MRVLVVEDESRLAQVIKKGLGEEGWAVDIAHDGEEGLYLAQNEKYDVIVLDIMLPKLDGLKICQNLRQQNITIPILMLTARTTTEDKVAGLENGADDYLTKPFAFSELRARLHALMRRKDTTVDTKLIIGDITVDPLRHQVLRGGQELILTPKEFAILEFLLRHRGEVVTRTMLLEHVWDYNFEGMSNIVDVFVASLRRKIGRGNLIKTVHGVGYKI